MQRREFITLAAIAAAWPVATRAQLPERVRLVGILLPAPESDREFQARLAAFLQGLEQLGWVVGRNLRVDTRWATADPIQLRRHAAELAALAPDVVMASGGSAIAPLLQATRTVPIVFSIAVDPVVGGLVESLARPGGNATGFLSYEYSVSGKWLELLKQIAPGVRRVGVLLNPAISSGPAQFEAIRAVAASFEVEISPLNMRDVGEIEQVVAEFARGSNGGLIVSASGLAQTHRDLIVALAARYRLPAVYSERNFVASGGLISYGPDYVEQFRRSAGYVDRILKGDKPADLPVQAPTRYESAINLKTARTLGLSVTPSLLALANEVIE